LRLIPSIIGGDITKRHGVVLAKSIPAKAYNIKTGEPVVHALRKCPSLVSAAPNHSMYQEKSKAFVSCLLSFCSEIEQVSIDECYMNYAPISKNYADPISAANDIKDTIYKKLGFTVNIGISDRKVLAKMASDFKKPNLVHTLYSHEIKEKLWPIPVSELYMCGRSSTQILHKLGIITIGDLAAADLDILESHLKSHGRTLWQYANGLDDSSIYQAPAKVKGIGNSTTLSTNVLTKEDAYKVLHSLSLSVSRRLKESNELATVICTEIKYASFQSASHQTLLERPTSKAESLYKNACTLFDELWDGSPVRLLGVRTSKLVPEETPIQLSLFDADLVRPKSLKQKNLDKALDSIRKKYGESAVQTGSGLTKNEE
ncbi:DNA polymerase IV, partial [Lachnospiraceae bacterium OttesenSCG-928-D06]|nr:DNA polymerase IV [Lachnospiraceae bacterium OttesenSCG-928-D06]